MQVEYSTSFKRQLKRLARRYRQIKSDIKPIIDALIEGETPGDQITGTGYTLYKVRAKNSGSQRGKSGGYRVSTTWKQIPTALLLLSIQSQIKVI